MRMLVLVLAAVMACARPVVSAPEPEPQGAELFEVPEPQNVFFMRYPFAQQVLNNAGTFVSNTGVEQAVCITRWNSLWKADTLRAIEVITVVPVQPVRVSDTTFVPDPAIGNCWWRFPSIHWHLYNDEPTEGDYVMAAHSQAPFHVVAIGSGENLRFRIYAVRKAALKRDNPR